MRQLDWYFDFISPYAYLQFQQLSELQPFVQLRYKPVLFAGLLKHWGNIGPAEIGPKRLWTYQRVQWQAHQLGLPLTMPEAHPFNPLDLLRLALHFECQPEVIRRLFAFVWQEGHTPQNSSAFAALLDELKVDAAQLQQDSIKQQLLAHSAEAIQAGVFGVPSAVVDGNVFWGSDSQAMLQAYLQGDVFFASAAYLRADDLPVGIQRNLAKS